jgi:hypothetical protein
MTNISAVLSLDAVKGAVEALGRVHPMLCVLECTARVSGNSADIKWVEKEEGDLKVLEYELQVGFAGKKAASSSASAASSSSALPGLLSDVKWETVRVICGLPQFTHYRLLA